VRRRGIPGGKVEQKLVFGVADVLGDFTHERGVGDDDAGDVLRGCGGHGGSFRLDVVNTTPVPLHPPPRACSSAAGDPGCFLAGLGQNAPAFNSETSRAALKDYEYPLGGDPRYPSYGSRDFGSKTCGIGFWVALAYPPADEDWTGWYTVGVDAVGGQFVENHVDVGTRHVIDLRVDGCNLTRQRLLGVSRQR
jgi:hypothetical protein